MKPLAARHIIRAAKRDNGMGTVIFQEDNTFPFFLWWQGAKNRVDHIIESPNMALKGATFYRIQEQVGQFAKKAEVYNMDAESGHHRFTFDDEGLEQVLQTCFAYADLGH